MAQENKFNWYLIKRKKDWRIKKANDTEGKVEGIETKLTKNKIVEKVNQA